MRICLALLLLAASVCAAPAQEADFYSDEALTAERARYSERTAELLQRGLLDFMSDAERQAVSGVQLVHPLRGSHVLDAFSYADRSTVVLPVLTLRFTEDLSVAYAWRYVNGYSLEPIDEYLAMLKYRQPADFPGGRYPDPLTAMGVPERAWEQDTRVDDLSLRFRNSMWAFVLAHELGHLRFGHPGNRAVDAETSQANEIAADAFAVELLDRSDTIPMGAMLWFQASVGFFKNRADFPSEAEYWAWVREGATHPVNPQRLLRLSLQLDELAASAEGANAETLRFIAENLVGIGKILAEPDMQRLVARCAVLGDPEDLKRTVDRPCDERLQ